MVGVSMGFENVIRTFVADFRDGEALWRFQMSKLRIKVTTAPAKVLFVVCFGP